MKSRSFTARLKQLERSFEARSRVSPDCICFPEKEPPVFAYFQQQRIAEALRCSLHGARFKPCRFFIEMADWLKEKLAAHLWTHHSERYRKAWFASFPPDMWPGEELEIDGEFFIVLKDGTRLSMMASVWIVPTPTQTTRTEKGKNSHHPKR